MLLQGAKRRLVLRSHSCIFQKLGAGRSNLGTLLFIVVLIMSGEACADDTPVPIEASAADAPAAMSLSSDVPNASPGGGIGGSMSPFIGESFQTDLATGAATMSVPITVPPGRKNMQPNVALSYSSNNSNGLCGVGWSIPVNLIQRSTKDGVPKYDDTDTFLFASSGANAELVGLGNGVYRPKIEGAFMKYLYDSAADLWTVYDKTGTKYTFGSTGVSRLGENNKTFGWYLDKVQDVYGNYITYIYDKPVDGQIYPAQIQYTGGNGLAPDKSVIFNYSENRSDKMYSYRSGWSIATTRLLSSIHVKLAGVVQWRYELAYTTSIDTGRSLLDKVTVYDKDGKSLPPKKFTYSRLD